MSSPQVVSPPDLLYRVERSAAPLRLSSIRPEDAISANAGNRFDVPGAGVLYAASSVEACYGETLARFRPSPTLPRELLRHEKGFMNPGTVPQDWRLKRRIVVLEVDPSARFFDVDALESQSILNAEMIPVLRMLGVTEPLDLSATRGQNRLLTRAIASWVYSQTDESGNFLFDGLTYKSRVSDDWTCWAIFEPLPVAVADTHAINEDDTDLKRIASNYRLTVF